MMPRFVSRALLALLTIGLCGSNAAAQLSPIERATAEALFQEGIALMDQGQYAKACEKFSGTLEIESGLGTMLHLADCYDKVGRTASSWALFEEVAARSKSSGDLTRQAIALERASDLKRRLTLLYLGFEAQPNTPDDSLFIQLSGVRLPRATWGSPIPVDPGQQKLSVGGNGYETWTTTLVLPQGPAQHRLVIPRLRRASPPPSQPLAQNRAMTQRGSRGSEAAESKPSGGGTLSALGYVTGALGLVGLGVGGYFGYRAYQSNQKSLEQCRVSNPNLCTPQGVLDRESAQRFAQASNIAVIAGGFGVVVGSTFLLVSPAPNPAPDAATGLLGLPPGGSLTLHGVF